MKICPQCHKHFSDEVRFCPKDGVPLSDITDPMVGRVLLGQFQIEELIGEGSMGKVYAARQLSVDRHVAVKVLKKKLANDRSVIQRFQREAKAAARLNHPNIITVHLVGETENDKIPYMVMEYVQGAPLEHVCKVQGAIEPLRVLTLTRQIVLALHEAHRNGVVHRDLKPDNINILNQGTPQESAKVLDFGIAKILHSDEEYQNLTKTGTIFGTPAYISPEQASGETLDHRTDLYSLGVIMFRMATGRLPFEDASGLEVLVRHIKEMPPRPITLNPAIPKILDDMIMKLLVKDRMHRYQSSEELLLAIDNAIIELGGVTPAALEMTGPTSRFTPDELRTESTPRGEVAPAVEEYGETQGKGLKFFIVVFLCIMVAAAAIFGVLRLVKGRGGGESESPPAKESVKDMTPPVMKKIAVMEVMKPVMEAAKPLPKVCDFLIEEEGSSRKTCYGSTVEVTVSRGRRRMLNVELYIPGMLLAKARVKPIDTKAGLKVFAKKKKKNEQDKMRLVVRTRHQGRADLMVLDPDGTRIANIYISLEPKGRRRKGHHRSMKRPSSGGDLPKLPTITVPLPGMSMEDPPPIMLPDPPVEMKPVMKPDSKPKLPDLPDF